MDFEAFLTRQLCFQLGISFSYMHNMFFSLLDGLKCLPCADKLCARPFVFWCVCTGQWNSGYNSPNPLPVVPWLIEDSDCSPQQLWDVQNTQ